jgi:glycosyltransferase involved in cell wall biosynthesis
VSAGFPAARPAPLLSICIPCYNGARYLKAVLEALLPQAREAGEHVEVLVVDDCSTDNTQEVVESARRHGPLRYIRNRINLGMAHNIVTAASKHASGEYVWVLSQHNIAYPGALARVLATLTQRPDLDGIYINFRCAKYPEQWPEVSVGGGYSGEFHYLANHDLKSHPLERWQDILDAKTSVGTQTYAHIIRRRISADYWATQQIGRNFANALDAYTQTCAVANGMFGKPSYYIGEPVLTSYDGAQTWSALEDRARVYLQAYPDLLRTYHRLGWHGKKLREAHTWGAERAAQVIGEVLRDWRPDEGRLIARYLVRYWHYNGVLPSALHALIEARFSWLSRFFVNSTTRANRINQYLFRNCRPARWVRRRLEANA